MNAGHPTLRPEMSIGQKQTTLQDLQDSGDFRDYNESHVFLVQNRRALLSADFGALLQEQQHINKCNYFLP